MQNAMNRSPINRVVAAREYPGGVVAIDSGIVRREMAACYLLETRGQLALIEVGSNYSAERILDVIRHRGWAPEQVSHVIVTHVHLDHAGGAGHLMQVLPEATLVVHPRGARHLVDPARLEAGTRAVYGDEAYEAMYGSLIPVPEDRMRIVADGERLLVGERELMFADTPGHARHHFCVWDQLTRGWFTGDTFGVSYRDLDTAAGHFLVPTTTPIQFEPEALIASVGRLMAMAPEYMYLTHYGRVGETQRLAVEMIAGVRLLVAIAERHAASGQRTTDIQNDILAHWVAAARKHGITMPDHDLVNVLWDDVQLNTQGIEYWLDHRDS